MQIVRFEIRLDFACENSLNNSKFAKILWKYILSVVCQKIQYWSVVLRRMNYSLHRSHIQNKQVFLLSIV